MEVSINLAVDDAEDFAKTVSRARRHGLKVTQAFDDLGVISGKIEKNKLPALRRVAGIRIEEDRAVSL